MNRILKPLLPSFFILLIVLFALPQENSLDTLISSLLVLTWGYYIFMVGIPSWNFSKDSLLRNPLFVILTVILIPFLLLIAAGSSLGNLWLVLLYYLLPAILFSLPQFVNEDTLSGYRSVILIVSNILGAAIIWIGFDHRHTTVLFDGFVDMGYVMNSFWMAAVILATFGQYSGVVRTDNDRDHGLMPTRYGNKIANVATPLASLIVIPFGLLTGFLLWNPVDLNIVDIIISFIGIYFTIALQEELIFRGIMLKELLTVENLNKERYYQACVLVITTIAFAFTHWNNEVPEYVYHYFFAAFVAGLAYAISYMKAGMFGAMLSHTLVDWVWALLLKRA